ncbi:MAG: SusC/RagA family TonB-linked outer membrane protein [Chitinophagaceae bacterium]
MSKLKQMLSVFFVLCGTLAMAQERTITGTVMSVNKAPVVSATVSQKGTKNATVTSDNGSFSLKVSGSNVVLIISSVGFTTQQVNVPAGSTTASVSLEDDSKQLGEVVVTALGISRQKKTLVYATQTVKPSELIEARDANNLLNSLSGKVANAVITQGSGGPGSGARIVLRGNKSIQGSNNALIVVDGVPISNNTDVTAGSDFGFVQGSDGASSINPDDIESVTVLRGASAAALYGSQAGNGVIIITTKKGKKDKISVTVNAGVAVESAFSLPAFQNSYGQGNGGVFSATSGESWGPKLDSRAYTNYLGKASVFSPQKDNVKDFFRSGTSFNNSIGVSGGTDKMQTYLSYTNNKIEGIIRGNDLLRHTVNLRITNQISSRFSTDAKVTYLNQDIKNRPRSGEENAPVINAYNMARNISNADAQNSELINNLGIPAPTPFPSALSSIYQNPYWLINRTSINESRDRIVGFLTAKFKITEWLALSGKANIDKTFDRGDNSVSEGTILWSKTGGDFSKTNLNLSQKWFDVMLEGNNTIVRDLKINYRIGGIFQDSKYDRTIESSGGLNVTNKFSMNYGISPSITSAYTQTQQQSVFGQANISYKDVIFVDASYRNEWDSRIRSPYTFSYPSVGVSAILSDLLQLPAPVSFLKANANYAQVGNGGKFGLLNPVYTYSQGAGSGFLQQGSTYPLPDLKPEITKSLELGLEARFFNNRIGFTAAFYNSHSKNQLLNISLPVATTYSSKYINAGDIKNTGFELVIDGSPIQKKDFKWNVTLNFATNKSTVVSLDPDIKIVYLGGGFGRSATPVVEEGKAFGDLLAFKWATDAKGNHIVNATNGKPVLTAAQEYIGNFNPKATVGFTNTFEYKSLYLRVLVDGRFGGTVVSGTEMNLAFSGITKGTEQFREGGLNLGGVDANGAVVSKTITAQDFWQIASGKRYGAGEFFAYDATNIRVRELSVGYSLPMKNTHLVKAAKLSLVARNLLFIYRGSSKLDIPGIGTRKMWFDPDMSLGNSNYQGVEYGTLPATRSLGLNLQVTF